MSLYKGTDLIAGIPNISQTVQQNDVNAVSGDAVYDALGREDASGLLNMVAAAPNVGGFAPAGYGGAGESLTAISATSASESDATYGARIDTFIASLPNGSVARAYGYSPALYGQGTFTIEIFKLNVNTVGVYFYNGSARAYTGWMHKESGTWQPFEWVNPPLVTGTEYRTTERYNGKPVYVRVASLTTPTAANTDTSTTFGSNVDKVISVEGTAIGTLGGTNYGFTIPYKDVSMTFNGGAFVINGYIAYVYSYTNAGFTWTSGYVIAKYTKTTD